MPDRRSEHEREGRNGLKYKVAINFAEIAKAHAEEEVSVRIEVENDEGGDSD